MAKEIINSSVGARHFGFMSYKLQISDGSVITVWARPNVDTTSVVRRSDNLKEIEPCDDEDVYVHRGRYYRFIPGLPEAIK